MCCANSMERFTGAKSQGLKKYFCKMIIQMKNIFIFMLSYQF